ncbi:hypothetical protein [Kitasatospora cineracea]
MADRVPAVPNLRAPEIADPRRGTGIVHDEPNRTRRTGVLRTYT